MADWAAFMGMVTAASSPHGTSGQGGFVVDWTAVGSLVSAGALVVAALTLIYEGRRWHADRRREEDERHEAERGLASFVSALTHDRDDSTARVVAANDGDRPVFNVRITSESGARLISRSDNRPLGDVIRRLAPQEQVFFTFQKLPGEAEFSRPVIDFFDMEGRRWLRRGFGAPVRRRGWWEDENGPRLPADPVRIRIGLSDGHDMLGGPGPKRLQKKGYAVSDLAAYFSLVKARPELFRNPPGASFEILLQESEIHQAEEFAAERLQQAGAPTEWAQVGVAFRDQYVLLLRDAVRFPDGSLGTYIRTVPPQHSFQGVVILPVWQGQVLLIRHFRHATRTWHLELPRGFGMGPDVQQSARHELLEEIGAADISLVDLGESYPDSGMGSSSVAFFYARIGSYGKPELHEGITNILPTPISEFERMIRESELKDGYLLAAYGLAKARNLI